MCLYRADRVIAVRAAYQAGISAPVLLISSYFPLLGCSHFDKYLYKTYNYKRIRQLRHSSFWVGYVRAEMIYRSSGYALMPSWTEENRFMSSRVSLPIIFFSRCLSAVMIWSVITLLSCLSTVTTASLGYNLPVLLVSGTTWTRARCLLDASLLIITAGRICLIS